MVCAPSRAGSRSSTRPTSTTSAERGDHGPVLPKLALRARSSCRDEGARPRCRATNGRGLSRKHIMEAIDASLQRLGRTTSTSTRSTAGTRDADRGDDRGAARRRRAGKARYIGASSMSAWQFAKTLTRTSGRPRAFVSMQNHYTLVYREEEREMIPLCIGQGIAVLPWSPLARGLLAGNPRAKAAATTRADTDRLDDCALRPRSSTAPVIDPSRRLPPSSRAARSRARLAATPATRDRADHRRDEDRPSRGCHRGRGARADVLTRLRGSWSPTWHTLFRATIKSGAVESALQRGKGELGGTGEGPDQVDRRWRARRSEPDRRLPRGEAARH